MRTIVAGSRCIWKYEHVFEAIEVSKLVGIEPTVILSGTAFGVDKNGERYATEHGIALERYPADWDRFGKRAGYLRNEEMANRADALIAVWNGLTRGTKHMIDIAEKRGLQVVVWRPRIVQPASNSTLLKN